MCKPFAKKMPDYLPGIKSNQIHMKKTITMRLFAFLGLCLF